MGKDVSADKSGLGQKIALPALLIIVAGLLLAGVDQDNIVARQGWGMLSAEIMLAALAFFLLGI